ncbi:MAG: hypothetical protein KAS93_06615 [Gammaproteobacteria bacterium]|nr:hypothetical protein [Gammaproteobacteria bacterium]
MPKIESLPDIDWSPEAALSSIQEGINDIDELFIIYHSKEDGMLYSSAAGMTTKDAFWMLEFEKARLIRLVTEGM